MNQKKGKNLLHFLTVGCNESYRSLVHYNHRTDLTWKFEQHWQLLSEYFNYIRIKSTWKTHSKLKYLLPYMMLYFYTLFQTIKGFVFFPVFHNQVFKILCVDHHNYHHSGNSIYVSMSLCCYILNNRVTVCFPHTYKNIPMYLILYKISQCFYLKREQHFLRLWITEKKKKTL